MKGNTPLAQRNADNSPRVVDLRGERTEIILDYGVCGRKIGNLSGEYRKKGGKKHGNI